MLHFTAASSTRLSSPTFLLLDTVKKTLSYCWNNRVRRWSVAHIPEPIHWWAMPCPQTRNSKSIQPYRSLWGYMSASRNCLCCSAMWRITPKRQQSHESSIRHSFPEAVSRKSIRRPNRNGYSTASLTTSPAPSAKPKLLRSLTTHSIALLYVILLVIHLAGPSLLLLLTTRCIAELHFIHSIPKPLPYSNKQKSHTKNRPNNSWWEGQAGKTPSYWILLSSHGPSATVPYIQSI